MIGKMFILTLFGAFVGAGVSLGINHEYLKSATGPSLVIGGIMVCLQIIYSMDWKPKNRVLPVKGIGTWRKDI
jgi:hypothetical protein